MDTLLHTHTHTHTQHGADVNRRNRDNLLPLDMVKESDSDIADLLRGDSALLDAAKKGDLDRVRKLTTSENINCKDEHGRNSTPLHLAGRGEGCGWPCSLPPPSSSFLPSLLSHTVSRFLMSLSSFFDDSSPSQFLSILSLNYFLPSSLFSLFPSSLLSSLFPTLQACLSPFLPHRWLQPSGCGGVSPGKRS